MNRTPDVELVLRDYLAGEDGAAPDYVLDQVERRIARQPQRRAWRLQGRLFMNTYAKLAAAAAAILVIGFVGWQLLPGNGSSGGKPTPVPTPEPTATVAASPTAEPYECEEGTGCLGELQAGTHSTSQFEPAFAYTTPSDWFNQIDIPTLVGITPADQPADMLLVWSGAMPAEQTATCELQAKEGARSTAADWMTYLTSHPGLDAQNVQDLTIGGRPAQSVDIRSATWSSPCSSDRPTQTVRILKTPDGAPGDGYGVGGPTLARVYVVDVGESAVVITLYAYNGGTNAFAGQIALGEPVVKSFAFDTPRPTGS